MGGAVEFKENERREEQYWSIEFKADSRWIVMGKWGRGRGGLNIMKCA